MTDRDRETVPELLMLPHVRFCCIVCTKAHHQPFDCCEGKARRIIGPEEAAVLEAHRGFSDEDLMIAAGTAMPRAYINLAERQRQSTASMNWALAELALRAAKGAK